MGDDLCDLSFDYIAYIKDLKEEVNKKTDRVIRSAQDRRAVLLSKLDEVLRQFEENQERISEELESIGSLLGSSREVTSSLEELDETMREVRERRDSLTNFTLVQYVQISWNPKLVNSISEYGAMSIVEGPLYTPRSENKTTMCLGQGDVAVREASAITIDPISRHFYLADSVANCVFVFSSEGRYLRQFGQGMLSFWKGMEEPRGISIRENRVFVTQSKKHCLKEYRMDGTLTQQVGTQGNSPIQFNFPIGIASESRYVYVCDCYNHRIQVLDDKLCFAKRFNLCDLRYPREVRLLDKHLFVLTSSSPCIQEIDKQDGTWVRSILDRGESLDVRNITFSFDLASNIIVCDSSSNCLSILSHTSAHLLHKSQFPDELQLRCLATFQGNVYVVVRDGESGKTQLICMNWKK